MFVLKSKKLLVFAWSLILTFGIHAQSATIENVRMVENTDCNGEPGVKFFTTGVQVNGMEGKKVHFGINVAQNGQWLQNAWVGQDPLDAPYPETRWEDAGWFCYKYSLLKQIGDENQPYYATFFVVDTATSAALGRFDVNFRVKQEEKKVSEGKATGTVTVNTKKDPVVIEVNISYKGPNRRVDGFLSVKKDGAQVQEGVYTFEWRSGGNEKKGKTSWQFKKEALGTGNFTAEVLFKGTGGTELGTASAEFALEEEKEEEGTAYEFDGPLFNFKIPNANFGFADGYVGGVGTVTIKGWGSFQCEFYVQRVQDYKTKEYTTTPKFVRAAPNCKNAAFKIGDLYYIGNMSNFEINRPAMAESDFTVKSGNVSMDLGGKPLQMQGTGEFNVYLKKDAANIGATGWLNFTIGGYTINEGSLSSYSGDKVTVRTNKMQQKLTYIEYRWEGGRWKFYAASPMAMTEQLKKEGFR